MSKFRVRELDHVNVRTENLDEMIQFYTDVLGLKSGPRPDFPFPGAWLYCGDRAALHLVGVGDPLRPRELQIEHFAFSAVGLDEFTERLKRHEVDHRCRDVPGTRITQVHLRDRDGNHLHIDFERSG